MFTSDMPWDPSKVDDEYDDWGDLPDPPGDNFIYVDQGLTDTCDEIFFDQDQEIDRLCRLIEFEIEDHEHGQKIHSLSVTQQKEKAEKL
jgi:hypothetical protein